MKKYKVENQKLIREEVEELEVSELSVMIRRLEDDIERNGVKQARIDDELAQQKQELKDLKKLAGENNVKY